MNAPDDYDFSKTVVPMKLAQLGDEQLISRSQAKRLIARFERFKSVILDFKGVNEIGKLFQTNSSTFTDSRIQPSRLHLSI